MAFEEEMRNAISDMDQSIHEISNHSPMVDYNKLCKTFARFCDNFNKFIEGNEEE